MSSSLVDQPGSPDPVTVRMASALETASKADARVERDLDPFSHLTATLPPELMAEGARRLGWLALMYALATIDGTLDDLARDSKA